MSANVWMGLLVAVGIVLWLKAQLQLKQRSDGGPSSLLHAAAMRISLSLVAFVAALVVFAMGHFPTFAVAVHHLLGG